MARKMVKPEKQLDPYTGGLDDEEFLARVGIPIDRARRLAAAMGAPFTADDIPTKESE